MRKNIKYLEFLIMYIAFACCFMPCLIYVNDFVIHIYVFDANKIMGYSYMILLILGIAYKMMLIKNKKDDINSFNYYFPIILISITTILYVISCLLRINKWISFAIGFYISIACLIITIILLIVKFILDKKEN